MGIGVIPILILVDSHSNSHVLFNSWPIPMGLPWDSQSPIAIGIPNPMHISTV